MTDKRQMKKNKTEKPDPEIEEWDLSTEMGILPKDIPFTQNIGCVGGKKKKEVNKNSDDEDKS